MYSKNAGIKAGTLNYLYKIQSGFYKFMQAKGIENYQKKFLKMQKNYHEKQKISRKYYTQQTTSKIMC